MYLPTKLNVGLQLKLSQTNHSPFHQVNYSIRQVNLKALLLQISFEPEIKTQQNMIRSIKTRFLPKKNDIYTKSYISIKNNMKYNKIHLLILLLTLSISISAQSVISGRITDKDNTPMASATILLLNHADSAYITGTISDIDGRFEILNLKPDNYILSFSMIGFKKINRLLQVGLNTNEKLDDIILEEDTYLLSTVTITGKRSPVKVEPGKMTINLSSALLSTDGNL